MRNSWYVKEDNQHHFFCKCGKHDMVEETENEEAFDFEMIDFKREDIDFRKIPNLYHPDNCCSVCGNERYLDMNSLLFQNKTLFWSEVKWSYEAKVDDEVWSVVSFIQIPQFDNKIKKFNTGRIELSSYCLDKQGKGEYIENYVNFFQKSMIINGEYWRFDRILKEEINKKISELIYKNPSKNIEWLKGKETNLKNLRFFLQNPRIHSQDMLYWKNKEYFLEAMNQYQYVDNFLAYILNHRKEKSLRKIQFISYEKMMKIGGYNPMVDYVFSRTITDVNHLHKALGMKVELKQKLFDGSNIRDIYHFIDFLNNQYEEKYIVKLWLSVSFDDLAHYLIRDSASLFQNREMRDVLNENFKKTALNFRAIHHELTRHSRRRERMLIEKKIFTYDNYLTESELTRDGICYKLPLNSQMLYDWGGILNNCLFSYSSRILKCDSTIFGLFVEKKLCYAIEIRNHKIVQASARFNRSLNKSEREKVDRWHKEVYLKSMMKSLDRGVFNK